jgi:hypothetical protein
MCRTRSLTLLLLCTSITACGYSFVLDGKVSTEKYVMEASTNKTSLIDAGTVLDSNLERTLSSMGMLASGTGRLTVHSTLASFSTETVTAPSMSASDRYRLHITVISSVTGAQGKELWGMSFTDTGTYSEGGRAEDALEEACGRVSLQIARALASLSL